MNRQFALKVFIIDKETSGKWIIKNKALVPWQALGTLFLIIHLRSVFIYYWMAFIISRIVVVLVYRAKIS